LPHESVSFVTTSQVSWDWNTDLLAAELNTP